TGEGGGERIPFGFLIGERGNEAPVYAGDLLGDLEVAPIVRQLGTHIIQEAGNTDFVDATNMAEVAILQPRQRAAAACMLDEGQRLGVELAFAVEEAPSQLDVPRQGETDAQVRIEIRGNVEVQAVGDDQVFLALRQ